MGGDGQGRAAGSGGGAVKAYLHTILLAAIVATSVKANIRRPGIAIERSPDAFHGFGLLHRFRSGGAL